MSFDHSSKIQGVALSLLRDVSFHILFFPIEEGKKDGTRVKAWPLTNTNPLWMPKPDDELYVFPIMYPVNSMLVILIQSFNK